MMQLHVAAEIRLQNMLHSQSRQPTLSQQHSRLTLLRQAVQLVSLVFFYSEHQSRDFSVIPLPSLRELQMGASLMEALTNTAN